MSQLDESAAAERVLVLTPTGRDAEMLRDRIVAAHMSCEICSDLQALLASIFVGAAAAVIAQEALPQGGAEGLLATLEAQEPWSDLPVLFLTDARSKRSSVVSRFFDRANGTLLQRPLGIQVFLSSIRSAVRARLRQDQMRDLHRELERALQLKPPFRRSSPASFPFRRTRSFPWIRTSGSSSSTWGPRRSSGTPTPRPSARRSTCSFPSS